VGGVAPGVWKDVAPSFNPLNPELNPICYLLPLLGAHHFLHVSRIRVKLLTFRLLMLYIYIYGADENCALLAHYAANSGNFLPTFRDNLSVPGFLTL